MSEPTPEDVVAVLTMLRSAHGNSFGRVAMSMTEVRRAADVIESLLESNAKRGRCLAFFRSVILSGEQWSATCDAEFDAAMEAADGQAE